LMTEFDQPDCAFSTPRRSRTTTPLQALTMMNHTFTLDVASALADRAVRESGSVLDDQIQGLYRLCFQRSCDDDELTHCRDFAKVHGLAALGRVILNTSELIHVD
ncbi:MAG: DUF1553 domain-containing protein, partial [Planctomycetota bacterium]